MAFNPDVFKRFVDEPLLTVTSNGEWFHTAPAFRLKLLELVNVGAPSGKKTWNGYVWMGDMLAVAPSQKTKVMGLFRMERESRSRTALMREIVSDGEVWADCYWATNTKPWVNKWGRWADPVGRRLVEVPRAKPLSKNIQPLIKAAFIEPKKLPTLLLED